MSVVYVGDEKGSQGEGQGSVTKATWPVKDTLSSQPPLDNWSLIPLGQAGSNVKHVAQSHSAQGTREQGYLNTDT